jgi:hypothetical protein
MLDILQRIIKKTLATGIGQSIIAFGAWFFVIVLLFVLIYYCVLYAVRKIKYGSK